MGKVGTDNYKRNEALVVEYMKNVKMGLKCFDNLIDGFSGKVDPDIISGDMKPSKGYDDGIYNILMKRNLRETNQTISFGRSIFEISGNFGCTIPNKLNNSFKRSDVMDYSLHGTLRYYGDDIFSIDCYNKEQKIELNDITSVGYYISADFDLKKYLIVALSSIENVDQAISYLLHSGDTTVKRIAHGINVGVLFGVVNQIMPINFSISCMTIHDWAYGLRLVDEVVFASDGEFGRHSLYNILNIDSLYDSYYDIVKTVMLNKDETNELMLRMRKK